jgi:2,4-dienoyl-CoA reductase (NADPH2)
MVSLARPMLADAAFAKKARESRGDEINVCIGCNQACLDHIFAGKVASCLVNPRACHETELNYLPTTAKRKFAVIGAGPAGLAASTVLAERGHEVHLFDAAGEIGGQLNMAKVVPGKEEFHGMVAYFARRVATTGVTLHLDTHVDAKTLVDGGFDEVIVATGVTPRSPDIEGQDHAKVVSYIDVLRGRKVIGRRVAVVGAGGIGFDVAEFLVAEGHSSTLNTKDWLAEWGVADPSDARGGIEGVKPRVSPPAREVWLLQRSAAKVGARLGKTTGWIHRAQLKMKRVTTIEGVNYERIGDEGLLISFGENRERPTWLDVDNIVLCTGQEPLRELFEPLRAAGVVTHLIGGADVAAELDAKRAIDQASRLAATL